MTGDFAARLEAGKIEIGEYKKLRHRPGPGENQNVKARLHKGISKGDFRWSGDFKVEIAASDPSSVYTQWQKISIQRFQKWKN